MKLEDQVVSLDLAKRLKELGVMQDSCFYWRDKGSGPQLARGRHVGIYVLGLIAAAFTVAELGEMLPLRLDARGKKDGRQRIAYFLDYQSAGLVIQYSHHLDTRQVLAEVAADTEADARAKMLIYLLENKLITV